MGCNALDLRCGNRALHFKDLRGWFADNIYLYARRLTFSYNMPKRTLEMQGIGFVEVWVLLENDLLLQ